jgi:NADPH2:quinone reductase
MLANVNLQKDLEMLARYGRVMVIGNRGSLDFNPRATMMKEADVRGIALANTPPADLQRIQLAIVAGLKAGFLRPVVGREFPLAQAPEAHRAVLEPGALGKIVLQL